jgi:hypothetical protein
MNDVRGRFSSRSALPDGKRIWRFHEAGKWEPQGDCQREDDCDGSPHQVIMKGATRRVKCRAVCRRGDVW